MPGLPDVIVKAPVFERLERLTETLSTSDPLLDRVIKRFTAGDDVISVAVDAGLYANRAEAAHFERDWLGRNGQGFWTGINTEEIIRNGMKLACEQFQKWGLPFELFWVIQGTQNSTEWEMSVTVGKRQITIMFHTPHYQPGNVQLVDEPNIWLVRRESGNLVTRKAKKPQAPPPTP